MLTLDYQVIDRYFVRVSSYLVTHVLEFGLMSTILTDSDESFFLASRLLVLNCDMANAWSSNSLHKAIRDF